MGLVLADLPLQRHQGIEHHLGARRAARDVEVHGNDLVDSLDEALEHIQQHGTGHSEAIITEDYSAAMRFVDEVDTAVVYVNASTQFTDGAQFGLGAEIIDSTQKTIARGPVGLREITTYKWVVLGRGQTRP